jgi:hypothetical protein
MYSAAQARTVWGYKHTKRKAIKSKKVVMHSAGAAGRIWLTPDAESRTLLTRECTSDECPNVPLMDAQQQHNPSVPRWTAAHIVILHPGMYSPIRT